MLEQTLILNLVPNVGVIKKKNQTKAALILIFTVRVGRDDRSLTC